MEGKSALESPLLSWDFQLCIWDKADLDEALASLRVGITGTSQLGYWDMDVT